MAEMEAMEVDDSECQDFLTNFKVKMDEQMTKEETDRLMNLLRTRLKDLFPAWESYAGSREDLMPSDLVDFLINNEMESTILNILVNVFGYMNFHDGLSQQSFKEEILEYKNHHRTDLLGREEEVKDILSAINDDKTGGIWVHGLGGIGKTACVERVCEELKRNKSEQICIHKIDLRKVTETNDLFIKILQALGYSPDIDSADFQQQVKTALENISNNQMKTVLLLDNIEDVFDNNPLELRACIGTFIAKTPEKDKWIFTSRSPFHNQPDDLDVPLKMIRIEPLSEKSSRVLLKAKCKGITSDEIDLVLDVSGRLPLAMNLLADKIKSLHKTNLCSRSYLVEQLHGKFSDVTALLNYAYTSISSETMKKRLLMLSVLQETCFSLETVKDILEIEDIDAHLTMAFMTSKQFVEERELTRQSGADETGMAENVYSFHSLVLEYLTNKHDDEAELISNARERLFTHIIHKIEKHEKNQDTHYKSAVYDIAMGHRSLFHACFRALEREKSFLPKHVSILGSKYLKKVLTIIHYSQKERIKVFKTICNKYEGAHQTYFSMFCRTELVALLTDRDECSEAVTESERALKDMNNIEETLDEQARSSLYGGLYYQLGRAHRKQNDFPKAIDYLNKALESYGEVTSDFSWRLEVAQVYDALGNVHFDKKDLKAAHHYHKRAAKIATEYVGNAYHPFITLFEFNVGTIYVRKAESEGDRRSEKCLSYYEKALQKFNSCMERDKRFGHDRHLQYTQKLSIRAEVFYRLKRFKEAFQDREDALNIIVDIHDGISREKTDALILKAMALHDLRSSDFQQHEKPQSESLLNCFEEAEANIRLGAFPSPYLKDCFLETYRKMIPNVSSIQGRAIKKFCDKYAANSPLKPPNGSPESSMESLPDSSSESEDMEIKRRASSTSDYPKSDYSSAESDNDDVNRNVFLEESINDLTKQIEESAVGVNRDQKNKRKRSDNDDSE